MKRSALGAAILLATGASAAADGPAWLDPALLAAAKGEGTPVIYSSVNEEEEMPQLARFEAATGIHVDYVRNSDTAIMARIEIEARAGKQSWDIVEIQAAESIPKELRLAWDPPESKNLFPGAKDPEHRWIGAYTVFHAPGYNTQKIDRASLPQSYADFAKHPDWAGHVGDRLHATATGLPACSSSMARTRAKASSRASSRRSTPRSTRGIWRSPARSDRASTG